MIRENFKRGTTGHRLSGCPWCKPVHTGDLVIPSFHEAERLSMLSFQFISVFSVKVRTYSGAGQGRCNDRRMVPELDFV